MRASLTRRRICPWRNVLVALMKIYYTSLCIFIHSGMPVNTLYRPRWYLRREYLTPCGFRSMAAQDTGFSVTGMLTILYGPHAYCLPNIRLQERCASGDLRAPFVPAAFHVVAGSKLRGDAAGDGAGQRTARTAARDHAVHNHERRSAGARGDQRVAFDG